MPSKLIHRFFQDPGTHYFLFGPRGTGKSTWITEHYGDRCLLIDMLQPDVFRYYQAKPERLYDTVKAHSEIGRASCRERV